MADSVLTEADVRALPEGGGVSAVPRQSAGTATLRALAWVGGFLLAFVLCWQFGTGISVHNDFTQNVWLPARLVLDGASPYYPTRAEVYAALGEHSAAFQGTEAFNSGENFNGIYPLWVYLLFSPFAAMPLVTALAVWRALNLVLLVWSIGAVLRSSNSAFRSSKPAALGAIGLTVLLGVIYRESFLTLYLGQFAVLEFGLLAAVWRWLVASSRLDARKRLWGDALAGLALAALATKPQVMALPVLLLLLWSAARRRWAVPGVALAATAALLVFPDLFYGGSLANWLAVVAGGQASSQVQVSASVWGVSYQWLNGLTGLNGSPVWIWVALALTGAGLLLLVPGWLRDLRDKAAPAPLGLLLAVCVNSVISPYLLGYEHVLLLFPALVLLASVGLPGDGEAPRVARGNRMWRFSLYTWMAVLPLLVVVLQAVLQREYPAIVQSLSMLALCWIARTGWKSSELGTKNSEYRIQNSETRAANSEI